MTLEPDLGGVRLKVSMYVCSTRLAQSTRTRSQAACQHLKAGVTAARWAKHEHWYHGLQALIRDYICLELLLKSPFPAFSVPTCPGTNPYAFILGPKPPSPRPACSGGPAGRDSSGSPSVPLSLWPHYPS